MNEITPGYILRRVQVHHKQDVLVDDQDLNDIIKAIKHYHKRHTSNYDDISESAWKGDPQSTARNLFDFCKKYIRYHVEPDYNQTIKSPGRIIEEGFGDCKHYASFINGIVDSLERKGYPISCCYRFVSDIPGKDVHHVFAVVKSKQGETWVDPVLQQFDERPQFHNTKDIAFSHGIGKLTYLSGTDAADIGKHGHGRAKFKKALQNVKKGINKDLHAIEHVALKVGGSPARNAFLALLDVNGFNLSTRVRNSKDLKGLQHAWKNLGGNPNKLMQAARNGQLFHAKLKHKPRSSVHGYSENCVAGLGAIVHTRHITTHPHLWVRDHYMRHHRRRRSRIDDGFRNTSMVAGSIVGVEPVSTASLMALASGVIALLSKFLAPAPKEHLEAMADAAKEGTADIIDRAAAADKGEGDAKANRMEAITTPSGGADASMSVKTGVDAQGQPQVTVEDVRHPALQQSGAPGGGAAADVTGDNAAPGDNDHAAPAGGDNMLQKAEDWAKGVWTDHKLLVILGMGGVVLFNSPKLQKKLHIR